MGVIAYRVRSMLRTGRLGTLVVTLIVAVLCGVVIAIAAGAERTRTSPDRYDAAYGGAYGAVVAQVDGGLPRTAEIAALPGVASADSFTFVFGGMSSTKHPDGVDTLTFSGSFAASGARLVAGRGPDPTEPGQFVATPSFVKASDASIGDTFDVVSLTQEQADTEGFTQTQTPAGPSLRGELVGIIDGPATLDDPSPAVFFSPAMLDLAGLGVSQSNIAVRFVEGFETSLFRGELDTLHDAQGLNVGPGVLVSSTIRTAIDAQARGLWLLAAVAAFAVVALLGQILTRQVRLSGAERDQLAAVGLTDLQVLGESACFAAIPVTTGALLGATLAVLPSSIFPTGFVRHVEPHLGFRFEARIVVLGAAVLFVAIMLWVLVSLSLGLSRAGSTSGSRTRSRAAKQSNLVESIITKTASASAATGLRFAFSTVGQRRGSTRAGTAGVLLTVAGLIGAITFGVSLNRLVAEPVRYGVNYDYAVGDNGSESLSQDLRDSLTSDPDVTTMILYSDDHARVGDDTVPLLGMEPVRGDGTPTIVSGRLPRTDDEIAFGLVTANQVGAHIGDEVTLDGVTGSAAMTVTGIAVVPGLGANEGIGEGGVLTTAALARLDSGFTFSTAAIDVRPGSDVLARLTAIFGGNPDEKFRPAAIVNVTRVRPIPFILAALLGSLVVLTIGQVMLTSLHSRRRDLAVLRALGADRRWITRALHWYATAFTVVPVVVGIPLGMLAGRVVFGAFADSMGAINAPALPLAMAGAVLAVLALLANLTVEIPARTARRVSPAITLQTD